MKFKHTVIIAAVTAAAAAAAVISSEKIGSFSELFNIPQGAVFGYSRGGSGYDNLVLLGRVFKINTAYLHGFAENLSSAARAVYRLTAEISPAANITALIAKLFN